MFDGQLADSPSSVDAAPSPPEAPIGWVEALSLSPAHTFSKVPRPRVNLLAGLGVEGDAHCAATDQHLSLGKPDPPPNLRQVHLFPAELMDELAVRGFAVAPGALGENMLVRGLDLAALPLGTRLAFSSGATVELTGKRTPYRLLDRLGKGLMKALQGPGRWGENPLAGVLSVVTMGGAVEVGEEVRVQTPPRPWTGLPVL